MTTRTETMEFQAETRKLLDLMIHSLYKHKEIFLRELISNASDALDKIRFLSLTEPSILGEDDRLHIRLEADEEDNTLLVADNGIGMSRDEVVANLGTIAGSGTQAFLAKLAEQDDANASLPELIGQFGVGFYSAFMVADEVVVDTRRYDQKEGVRWRSRGDGTFTVEAIEKPDRGTTIVLHLKKREGDEPDFTREDVLRDIVKRYSDFVSWPIEMEVEREEEENGEKKKVRQVEVLNSMKPLWTRPPGEVTEEEHAEFYRHLTHDWEKPRRAIHFHAEGTLEYTALLYIPSHRPLLFQEEREPKSRLSLYVKRVFIMDDCDELLPPWLRFVRGLVDSADLPLNVSRETLQHSRQMRPIKKRLTTKVLETLGAMLEEDREEYQAFFSDFGPILKEGIYLDDEFRKEVAGICLFHTTGRPPRGAGSEAGDAEKATDEKNPCTLAEYVERMPFAQKEIYYLAGTDRAALARSPHLEAFRRKGFEVLLLTDPVDEFAMARLAEFEGKPIRSAERERVAIEDEGQQERKEKEEELKPLLEKIKDALQDRVADVRFSKRLTDSSAVLVTREHDLTPQMRRVLEGSRQELPESKRILEINPEHPLVQRMSALKEDASLRDHALLLLGQAQLAEGSPVDDPIEFNRIISDILARSGDTS